MNHRRQVNRTYAAHAGLDLALEHLRAVERRIAPVRLRRAVTRRLLVVPADDQVLVNRLRALVQRGALRAPGLGIPAAPFELRLCPDREIRVQPLRADGLESW